MNARSPDCAGLVIVGAGVLGCALARHLAVERGIRGIVLLEKEDAPGQHASGRNSCVAHSGFHLPPGSLKARVCIEGHRRLAAYCRERGLPFQRIGKLVVACDAAGQRHLPELAQRAAAHGLAGCRLVDRAAMLAIEPHIQGLAGFYSPHDGIFDAAQVVARLAEDARQAGVDVRLGTRVRHVRQGSARVALQLEQGGRSQTLQTKWMVACAGVQADWLAQQCGLARGLRMVPFRGEYFALAEARAKLVRGLVYPVFRPELPFLGVHLTRTVDGRALAGPNAVLAFGRESYRTGDVRWGDCAELLRSPNFWRMALRGDFLAVALGELWTSLSAQAFLDRARTLLPALQPGDLTPERAGNRAQLVDRQGRLVKDFLLAVQGRTAHVLNAVSPGFTSSLAFARLIARRLIVRGFFG